MSPGMPVFGTCAGMILLASEVLDGRPDRRSFGVIDLAVRRNAFGRQIDSFEADLDVDGVGRVPAVFIRAPYVERVGDGGGAALPARAERVDQRARQQAAADLALVGLARGGLEVLDGPGDVLLDAGEVVGGIGAGLAAPRCQAGRSQHKRKEA